MSADHALPDPTPSWTDRIKRLSADQKVRYLAVGAWNTIFGNLSFGLAYFFFGQKVHYLILITLTSILNVTCSFFWQKLLVFQTKGNAVREYLRFWGVQGTGTLISLGIFAFSVRILGLHPYLAQAVTTILMIFFSFFGHKNISFKQDAAVLK